MKTNKLPFTGIWYVETHEIRVAGKWKREYEYEPGEWSVAFMADGRLIESFRDECGSIRLWEFDDKAGIISIFPNLPTLIPKKCVFDSEGYLYYCGDPHIRGDAPLVIAHQTRSRLKLVRLGNQDRF